MNDHLYVKPWAGGWAVYSDSGKREVVEPWRTRADAVIHAKELARSTGPSQILVYDEQGELDSEFFYQADEREALDLDDSVPSIAASKPVRRGRAGT
ncbi:hypothetical protein AKJ09_00142 [Labilithrix luteola]|uniref:DUF2188 domain-containing protein n=1 Tax=Labilithrix luteola TaxID=1391654 RepID=A0A0K1PIV7_9BACT|nr:DUF2188 domain-containing protein [Labilithrix luteola]AKU93478.1 hypothetical protein AKJ09_00142 [Labilithrix luteola]